VQELGKGLIAAGLALVILGALAWLAPQLPLLGKLPGDIRIERPGFRLYLPIASCLALSAVLTLLLHLISRIR
jgi:hypothetical protein